jgi:nitric oxide reductase NorD protein
MPDNPIEKPTDKTIAEDRENALIARFADALLPLINRFGYEGIAPIGRLIARLKQENPEMALYLLEQSPSVIKKLLPAGEESVLSVFALGNQMIPFDALLVVRLIETSPEIIAAGGFETLVKTAALAAQIVGVHSGTAKGLIEKSPSLIKIIGFDGLQKVSLFAGAIAGFSWTYALKAVENSLPLVSRLLEKGGKALVLAVYDLGRQMAADSWNDALEFVQASPLISERLLAAADRGFVLNLLDETSKSIPFKANLSLNFLTAAPHLIDRLGRAGLESIRRCLLAMAVDKQDNTLSFIQKSPEMIDRLLSHWNLLEVTDFFNSGRDLAVTSARLAFRFLTTGVELSRLLDYRSLKILSETAEKIAGTSQAASEAFLEVAPALVERIGLEGLGKVVKLTSPLAEENWETAAGLLLKSPDLIDRLGLEGLNPVVDFLAFLARESGSAAGQFLDKCSFVIDELLKLGDGSFIFQICRLGRRMARENPRLAVSFLDRSPEIIRLIGFSGLQKVEELAYPLGLVSWTAAVSLVEVSPLLLKRVNFAGLEEIARVAQKLARENSFAAVSLFEKSPDLVDQLLDLGDRALVIRIYGLAGKALISSWRMASTFLEKSPVLFSKLGAAGLEKLIALMNQTAKVNGQIAARLLDLSPNLLDQIEFEGLGTIADLVSVIAETDWMSALSVLEKSPLLIDRLGRTGDGIKPVVIYDLAVKVARVSPTVAMKLLEKSPEFLHWVGLEGFGRVAAFIENTAQWDEEKALSFLSTDSPALADFMENIPQGLEMKTIKPILSSYLRALLGRRVELAEGESGYTDGRKIYLPRRIREFQDQKDNFIYYKVSATHQEAHLEYGSFEFGLGRIEDCIKTLKLFFPSPFQTESTKTGGDLDRFLKLFPEPDLARDLFDLMEDYRIGQILEQEYPALGQEIQRMNSHQSAKRRSPMKMTNPKQRIVEMVIRLLLAGKTFGGISDSDLTILKKARELAESLDRPEADVHDSARAAANLYLIIDKQYKEAYRPLRPISKHLDQDRVVQNIGSFGKTAQQIQDRIRGRQPAGSNRSQRQPEAESGSEGETQPTYSRPGQENIHQGLHHFGKDRRSFQNPMGGGKQESGEPDQEREETSPVGETLKFDSREKIERLLKALYREGGITPKEIERRLESLHQNEIYFFLHNLEASLARKTELQIEKGTSLVPEWGEDIHDYRSNWARIREQALSGKSLAFYKETLEKHAGLLKKIRREFQLLKPEGFTRRKRQYDGDDIDLEAVVEYWVDRRAGLSPSEKNYILHQKKKRDIAVAFLVDMSRSTKGATIELEKESLVLMSEALNEVGDAFAIYGFSGDNRDNVDFYRVKDFEDPYDLQVKKRISAIQDRFENRDGAAVRHSINKLRKRPERTKMLILLSDGKPVDKEYSGTYAIEDTRMALKEAGHYGIRTFCITVDRTAAEYLPRMYSHSSWTVIDEVTKLPEKITRIYRMLTV